MINNSLKWSILFLVMLLMGTSHRHQAMARSAEGLAKIEKILSSSSSSSRGAPLNAQGASPLAVIGTHALPKRAVLDQSCKGIYDGQLFQMVDRVCEDCYNLYRKPYVGVDCRNNCYNNLVFLQCLDELLLWDSRDRYIEAIRILGK